MHPVAGWAAGAALGILLAATPSLPVRAEEEAALTNVDVVRMVMAEVPPAEIIQRIRASPARFDVAPEILTELEAAGVPAEVIAEMVARSRQARKEEPVEPSPGPAEGSLEIVFEIDPGRGPAGNSVVAPSRTPPFVKEEGRYIPGDGPPEPVRLAFFVTCSTVTHVPDYWRRESRIGDLVGRHRLLFFQEATREVEDQQGWVYLDHPDSWSFPVTAGRHEGHLGVAAAVGESGRFLELFMVPYEELVIREGKTTRMTLRVTSPGRRRRSRRGFMRIPGSGPDARGSVNLLTNPRLKPRIVIVSVESPDPPAGEP